MKMRPSNRTKRRLLLLVAVGLVAILGSWCYVRYWISRPIGSGPAGPAVSSDAFQAEWTDKPVVLLGVGDSMTAGLGASRPDLSYFNRLVSNPPDEFEQMQGRCLEAVLPHLEATNVAVSGSNSIQHLDMVTNLPEYGADVAGLVVITTGGNDLIHWYGRKPPREGAMYGATLADARPWIDRFRERLSAILDGLESKFPGGCQIFLGDIYDPTDGVGDAPSVFLPHWPDGLAIHGEYNQILRAAAEQRPNVHLVPIHATFLGHGSHCRQFWRRTYRPEDPHYWYFINIEDPNDRGYDALRRIFLREIVQVMTGAPQARTVEPAE